MVSVNEQLYREWTKNYNNDFLSLPNIEDKELTIERILRTKIGVAQSLELALPTNYGRHAYLQISKDGDSYLAEWHKDLHSNSEERHDLSLIIKDEASLVGELSEKQAEALSTTMMGHIFENNQTNLHGFSFVKKENASIWYKLDK